MNLRKINRGLVLGFLIAACTATYVVVDNSSFKKESKPEIEKVTQSFIEDLAQANVGNSKEVQQQTRKVLDDYFTDYKNNYDYSFKKSDFMSELDDKNFEPEKNDAVVSKVKTNIRKADVSKCGTDGANVQIKYDTYVEFSGKEFNFEDLMGATHIDVARDNENADKESYKNKHYSSSYTSEGSIYVKKVDGEWKIASSNMGSETTLYDNFKELDETEETAETENTEKDTSAKEDK